MALATVTKAPTGAVSKLSLEREKGTFKMKATWSVPGALVKSDSHKRATGLRIKWRFDLHDKKKKKDPKETKVDHNEKHTSSTVNLNNLDIGKKTYTRSDFYPHKGKPKLDAVYVSVTPYNSKGSGKTTNASVKFNIPDQPKVSAFSFNAQTGVVSTTITPVADKKATERRDTRYTIKMSYHPAKGSVKKKTLDDDKIFGANAKTFKYDVDTELSKLGVGTGYQGMGYDEYVHFNVIAKSRGFAGKSDDTERNYYVSYPGKAVISKAVVPEKKTSGKCNVYLKTTGHSTAHPVDQVKLEYLANVEYAKASEIPSDAGWTQSPIVDNKDCKALSIPVADIMPQKGNHTWVRVMSWHANEEVLYRYSDYVEVKDLYEPAPQADAVDIVGNIQVGADGRSAIVQLGWNKDGDDDSTGTELTWSDEEDAWTSTEPPSQFLFDWSEGRYPKTGTKIYNDSARVTIKNLNAETKYYVKARRYLENGSTTDYSNYAEGTVITSETPDSIMAVADSVVPVGASLPVRWSFSGGQMQKRWQICTTDGNVYTLTQDLAVVTGKNYYVRSATAPYTYTLIPKPVDADIATYYELTQSNGAIIESGEGSIGTAQISAEKLQAFSVNNILEFTVQASTGGEFVVSEVHRVTIAEPPVLELDMPETLTKQPLTFDATVTSASDLTVVVTSQGIAGQMPAGQMIQANGDTVFSGDYTPVWVGTHAEMNLTADVAIDDTKTYYIVDPDGDTLVNEVYYKAVTSPVVEDIGSYYEMSDSYVNDTLTARISLPEDLNFIDSGKYDISVVAIDSANGLQSAAPETLPEFVVAWAHQAPNPDGAVTITPIDEVDDEGDHTRAAQIVLTPPVGSYIETSDAAVVTGKDYFSRSGSGTEEDPYEFEAVTPDPGDNPASEGWFELANDLYDIYRMDIENPSLIGRGFPLNHTVVDQYAPFGDNMDLFYRIAVRTEDGDQDFADIAYTAPCENMRFDWALGMLELHYGLSMGDSYKKDVAIRQHMDGSSEGYWNPNIERKSGLRSDIIKIAQPQEVARARALGRYAGPVFVRLPDGSAFEADVQVTDLSKKNDEVKSVAIDANEIGITNEFALPVPYVTNEEQEP